jgi:hypothetical protein
MKSFGVIAAFVAAANAYAYNTTSVPPPGYETTIYCEGPTTIPVGPSYTITVTEPTSLTITYPVGPSYTPAPPKPVYPSSNGTAPYPTGTAAPTQPSGTAAPTEFPGSATGRAGLSLLAVGGALAAFL